MPKRTYRRDPAELLEEGRAIMSSSSEAKFQHRVEMVSLVLAGLIPQLLSEHVKESKNAITSWVKIADEQGFEDLHHATTQQARTAHRGAARGGTTARCRRRRGLERTRILRARPHGG